MAKQKKKIRAGVGARCSIFTRFLYPKQIVDDNNHRSNVVLVAVEDIDLKGNGKKKTRCYTCTIDIDGTDQIFHAPANRFKIEQEGAREKYFVPLTEKELEDERQAKTSSEFKEPKIKWQKSHAKKLLYHLIMDGVISDVDNEDEDQQEIYLMCEEFAKYDFGKFGDRLSQIRKKIAELNSRAKDDELAFENYKQHHKPSLFSHKGYVQWQGSTAQDMLLDDMERGLHQQMTPKELWESRKEYTDQFPLHAFRSKLEQEIRTAKYIHTLQVRGMEKKDKAGKQ
jgi:hypothetical protein